MLKCILVVKLFMNMFYSVVNCSLFSSGKKRRLTFIECNNDINTMIDLAKVADLVRFFNFLECTCNIEGANTLVSKMLLTSMGLCP